MHQVSERWAKFGKRRKWQEHTPRGGVCLSAFVIIRNGNSLLMGLPRATDAWPETGGYPKFAAKKLERSSSWLLPATHLLMDESPHRAAERIVRDWVGLKGKPTFIGVQSHTRPSGRVRGYNHWDICFVYGMKSKALPKRKPWWSEMRYMPLSEIRKSEVGRGHADVLREAGLLK